MANLRVDKITSTETFETTGSVQFDGSGDYLETTLGAFGTSEFTIEYWIAPNFISGSYVGTVRLQATTTTKRIEQAFQGSTLQIYTDTGAWRDTGFAPPTSQWTHIALVKYNNKLNLYANGSSVWEVVNTRDYDESFNVDIGSHVNSLNGFISNVRIIKGKALYTANFKPPMRELEVVPGTVLLCCQSKTDATLEKTGKTITVTGNAVASELTPGILTPIPKAGAGSAITGSVEFDGSGSTTGGYLEVTPDNDLQFLHKCTDSYTVEAWVHKQASTQGTIFDNGGSSSSTIGIILFGDSGGVLKFRARQALSGGGFHSISTGDVMANDMWHHVALTYDKSTVRLFVNGILAGSTSYNTESSTDSTQSFKIGAYEYGGTTKDGYFNGHISNLRVVKGTALYTDNFIPPTRELKKIPGTVLLCCQDPDNPLTEATGKTITGYGDLSPGGGSNLISNAYDAYAPGDTTGWSTDQGASLSVSSGRLRVTNGISDYGIAQTSITTIAGQRYVVRADFHPGTANQGELRASNTSFSNTLGGTGLNASAPKSLTFTAASTTTYINVYGSNTSGEYSEWANFSVTLAEGSNKGSNFTPQVGDDRKVTLEGVTKINSDAYFYLPTGNTESRDSPGGHRGLFMGGSTTGTIEFVTISTTSNALSFGNLYGGTTASAACSSSTRGVSAGGLDSPVQSDVIEYVTIASTGNAIDFGSLTDARRNLGAASNSIRGLFFGGSDPAVSNIIDFITIPSTGSALDFGDISTAVTNIYGCASPTRGILGGGEDPNAIATIEYVTIASKGDAQDFGDLFQTRSRFISTGSGTRGVFAAGRTPTNVNTIDYVTIASTGNAKDFGDVTLARQNPSATSDSIRGVIAGGYTSSDTKTIDFIAIPAMGNALDFGDLITARREFGACSNGHGGLG